LVGVCYCVCMDTTAIVEDEWQYVLNMMPADLEESAVEKLALRRRREITSASDLLRLALCYGLCDFSLRQVAAWASVIGLGNMSDVAVYKRLRQASDWLGHVVVRWLQKHGLSTNVPKMAVRVVDATSISGPGSRGTDWRLHLGLDLAQLRIRTVELTDAHEGESLQRHTVVPGEIVVADAGYGHRTGVAGVIDSGGHVVVRINWQNFPLETRGGGPLDTVTCLETLGPGELGDWQVQFRIKQQVYPVRLVAVRTSREAARRARKRLRRAAARKGRKVDPRSLRAAKFAYVITDMSGKMLPTAEALELYRLRWQIEIAFKRLKRILRLGDLRAKDERLARAYLYAKLLAALILDELCRAAETFSPWGYPLLPPAREPLAGAVGIG
jgi:hypothetical protein